MKKGSLFIFSVLFTGTLLAQEYKNMKPEDTEYYEPRPREVQVDKRGVPEDALVLFSANNLDEWVSQKDKNNKAEWDIDGHTFVVKPGSGNIQTKKEFGSFQLHLEWKSPEEIKGEGQGRGNSGVFLQGMYEIQILDNQDNPTYVNGQAGSLYKQRPPLVDVKADGEGWHSYDIIYNAPYYNADGQLIRKGNVTVFHNGVLIHNHTQIEGTTEYIGLPKLTPHGKGPIILQDHGDLVKFRNIWIREL